MRAVSRAPFPRDTENGPPDRRRANLELVWVTAGGESSWSAVVTVLLPVLWNQYSVLTPCAPGNGGSTENYTHRLRAEVCKNDEMGIGDQGWLGVLVSECIVSWMTFCRISWAKSFMFSVVWFSRMAQVASPDTDAATLWCRFCVRAPIIGKVSKTQFLVICGFHT